MPIFLKRYGLELLQILGIAGLGICSIWYSSWISYAQTSLTAQMKAVAMEQNVAIDDKPDFWSVTNNHISDFRSPVPYTFIVLGLTLLGSYPNIRNKYKLNKANETIQSLESSVINCQEILRDELNLHSETKQSYYEALDYLVENILTNRVDFDETCRVTIYRHIQDEYAFQLVYRHSLQDYLKKTYRNKIPDNEGFIAAAWNNEGIASVGELPVFDKRRGSDYRNVLHDILDKYRVSISDNTISKIRMESRCYLALRITGTHRNNVAVVVFESTTPNKFNRDAIHEFIKEEHPRIAEYIMTKIALDENFNLKGG